MSEGWGGGGKGGTDSIRSIPNKAISYVCTYKSLAIQVMGKFNDLVMLETLVSWFKDVSVLLYIKRWLFEKVMDRIE